MLDEADARAQLANAAGDSEELNGFSHRYADWGDPSGTNSMRVLESRGFEDGVETGGATGAPQGRGRRPGLAWLTVKMSGASEAGHAQDALRVGDDGAGS